MRRLLLVLTVLALATLSAGAAIAGQRKDPEAPKSWPVPTAADVRALSSQGAQGTTPVGTATLRVAGSDRFTTAAAISDAMWDYDNTIVVYLANGQNFPDALGLGASTLELGPLLLVTRDALPAVTRAQLERLRPCLVVAAGGAGAISQQVLLEADRYTDPAACHGLF